MQELTIEQQPNHGLTATLVAERLDFAVSTGAWLSSLFILETIKSK